MGILMDREFRNMLSVISQRYKARTILLVVWAGLLVLLLHQVLTRFAIDAPSLRIPTTTTATTPEHGTQQPQLPAEYSAGPSEKDWCQDRLGTQYLFKARDSAVSYCSTESASQFSCFWSSTADGENRMDAMCHGRGGVFDSRAKRFGLGCSLRPLTPDEIARGVPSVPARLTSYWYNTGPSRVVEQAVSFIGDDFAPGPEISGKINRTSLLLKREGSHNLWHSLMEIISLSWSLDTLRITQDESGGPLLSEEDAATTQVLILDDHPEGPYFDLWRLFAKMPTRRLADVGADEPPSNVVIPFAGASNPLWQGDWKEIPCYDSALVKTFVSRVMRHYEVGTPDRGEEVAVTFIRRTTTRKLVDEESHVRALREAIPHMRLEVVDFATMSFREQLEVVRRTDLLVGVHGAGLTHSMFLPPGSAVVEILPSDFAHKGFRNLAQVLGHGYFRTHGTVHRRRNWQNDDVEIKREAIVDVVAAAVKSLYSKGPRSFDVS